VRKLDQIGALPKQVAIAETLSLKQDIPESIKRQQEFVMEMFNAHGNLEGLVGEQNRTHDDIMIENPIQEGTYE
jgi:hypothetical protein